MLVSPISYTYILILKEDTKICDYFHSSLLAYGLVLAYLCLSSTLLGGVGIIVFE